MKKYEKIFNGLVTENYNDDDNDNKENNSESCDNESKFEIKIIRKDNKKSSIDYDNDSNYIKHSSLNQSKFESKSRSNKGEYNVIR